MNDDHVLCKILDEKSINKHSMFRHAGKINCWRWHQVLSIKTFGCNFLLDEGNSTMPGIHVVFLREIKFWIIRSKIKLVAQSSWSAVSITKCIDLWRWSCEDKQLHAWIKQGNGLGIPRKWFPSWKKHSILYITHIYYTPWKSASSDSKYSSQQFIAAPPGPDEHTLANLFGPHATVRWELSRCFQSRRERRVEDFPAHFPHRKVPTVVNSTISVHVVLSELKQVTMCHQDTITLALPSFEEVEVHCLGLSPSASSHCWRHEE